MVLKDKAFATPISQFAILKSLKNRGKCLKIVIWPAAVDYLAELF